MRVDNHIHIRHIMLYHYQKGWEAAQSFRDLNDKLKDGLKSSNRATQTSRTMREEVDHRILTIRLC